MVARPYTQKELTELLGESFQEYEEPKSSPFEFQPLYDEANSRY